MKERGLPAALALAALLLLPSLAFRGIWPPDETRYADVARGMLASGDFVVPRLHDRVYREKPPVFFWASAGLTAFGVPLGVAPRLVSVLSGLATLALVPIVGGSLGFAPRARARGAVVLATTPLFLAYAQMGLLDALSTFLVTSAIAAKCARASAGPGRRRGLVLAEGFALGLALLTKGPVLLLFPLGLRAGGVLSGGAQSARPDRSDALALALALAAAGGWLAAAAWGAGGPDYVRSITLGQAVRRVTGEAPHLRAPGFLLATSLLGFLPWSVIAASASPRLWREPAKRWAPGAGPLLGWVAVPLLLLSLLATQQPHYVLPAVPAAALGVGALLGDAPPARVRRVLVGLGLVFGVGALAAAVELPRLIDALPFDPAARVLLLGDRVLRVAAFAIGVALLGLSILRRRGASDATWCRTAAGSACLVAGLLIFSWRTDPLMLPRGLLARPELRSAARVLAPMSLRSVVRVEAGRSDVDALSERELLEQMRQQPDTVALVWQRDVERIGAPPGTLQEIGRGFVRGRTVVALRLAPGAAVSQGR